MKAIFITVRTGSKRLANKCLLKINGTTTIEHLIRRVKKSKKTDLIVLCTSNNKEDDILCDIAVANNIDYYRGSSKDKLERWNGACNKYQVNFFVTADWR
jgi:spore coat polysaccharide biosynthesis protein SpsF (cytidylyltransferase family)